MKNRQGIGEQTLVIIKTDAIKRGLVGKIIKRLEQPGLKMVACKLIFATKKQLEGHFPSTDDWIRGLGDNTLKTCQKYKANVVDTFGSEDPFVIGQKIKKWNFCYLSSGLIMPMVFQGVHAVDTARKIVGHTLPYLAEPGTIRGDFSIDSPISANKEERSVMNLIHASKNTFDAKHEISNWFDPSEIFSWERYTDLEEIFEACKETDPRNAAEYAYAISEHYRQNGNTALATHFSCQAITLLDKCKMETMEECTPSNDFIGEVAIPSSYQRMLDSLSQYLKL